MRHSKVLLIASALIFIYLAASCGGQKDGLDTTSPPPMTAPGVEFALQATQFAQEAQATMNAQSVASTRKTQTFEAQSSLDVLNQMSATAEWHAQATALAIPMHTQIEKLNAMGILTSTQGTYFQLDDLDVSWAQRDHYDTLLTENIVSDFVVVSKIEWETAGVNIDDWNSGCGFVFRLNARGDHYLAYVGSDGWAYLYLALDHRLMRLGRGRFSEVPLTSRKATLLLLAQAEKFILFVNDTQVLQLEDHSLSIGFLGYAIASGTNTDPGTHCQMTKNELWKSTTP